MGYVLPAVLPLNNGFSISIVPGHYPALLTMAFFPPAFDVLSSVYWQHSFEFKDPLVIDRGGGKSELVGKLGTDADLDQE